jgi:hypothetical protein
MPTQQPSFYKDIAALRTEMRTTFATLCIDLNSSRRESAAQVQNALTMLRNEMENNKQDTMLSTSKVQNALNTLRTRMEGGQETVTQDALATLRAELKAEIMREMQSIQSEPARTPSHRFQGDMVTTQDDLHVNEPVMVETGEGHVDLAEGDVVAFQLATNNTYLHVAHADTTLPIDHLVWKEVDQPIAEMPECLFIVEGLEGDTFHLCSASTGDFLQLRREHAFYDRGLVATLAENISTATCVTLTVEDNNIRLAGPKRQQLSCITLNNTDILATCSILPTTQGLFILHCV